MRKNQLLQGVLLGVGMLAACSSPSTPPASGADMAHGTGGGGDKDMTMQAGMEPPEEGPDMTMTGTLPLPVDGNFIPAFMGDGEQKGPLTMTPGFMGDTVDCNNDRSSPSAIGICHIISYIPPMMGGSWGAGVYWLYPDQNWGTSPGLPVPQGATKVTFSAKAAKDGLKVEFFAGGIGMDPAHPAPYKDNFKADKIVTLTSAWTAYELTFPVGTSYSDVSGGFGWSMGTADAGAGVTFQIDDIQWVK